MDSFLNKGSSNASGQQWLSSKSRKARTLPQNPGDHINRDTYGFKVPAQHVETYKRYARIYQVEEEERSLRWDTFLATYGVSDVPEAKMLEAHETNGVSVVEDKAASYVVDQDKRRGQGGDAKFKSNFRPELWLIERAVHAKILSGNGKAAQMDSLVGLTSGQGEVLDGRRMKSASSAEKVGSEDLRKSKPAGFGEGSETSVQNGEDGGQLNGHGNERKSSQTSLSTECNEDAETRRSSYRSDGPSSVAWEPSEPSQEGNSSEIWANLESSASDEEDDEVARLERAISTSDVGPQAFSWAAWAQELNSLVMGGVPMALRGEVWQIFVGTKARREEGLYDSLLEDVHKENDDDPNTSLADIYARIRERDAGNPWAVQIEKDLPRTFPGHPALDSIGRDSLRRLLTAYAMKVPEVGYCQGMNFLGGLLLLLMPEENAFWTLYGIIEDYLHGYYSDDMIEAQVDQLAFEELVRQNFPRLASHLEGMGVQISWVTGPWFLSVFVNVLPWESVLRVWDVMLYQRSRSMLFRTALALLEMHSVALLDCRDTGDIMASMQGMTGGTFDSSELVLRACVGYMDIDDEVLEKLREKHRPAVMDRLAERKASLARYQDSKTASERQEAKLRNLKAPKTCSPTMRSQDDLVLPSAFAAFQRDSIVLEPKSDQHKAGLNFPKWVHVHPLPPKPKLQRSSSMSRLSPALKVSVAKELSSPIRRLLFPRSRNTAITLLKSSALIHRPLLQLQTQLWTSNQVQEMQFAPCTPQPQPVGRSPLQHLLRHHSDASAAMLASLTLSPSLRPQEDSRPTTGPPPGARKPFVLSSVSELGPSAVDRASSKVRAREPSRALSGPYVTSLDNPLTPFAERLNRVSGEADRDTYGMNGELEGRRASSGTWELKGVPSAADSMSSPPDSNTEDQLKRERAIVADLREQVAWLKEQLVLTLEAEQEASLRANELQIAMVEMAERDNSQSLAVKVEAMESEIEVLRRELERQQERSAQVLAGALAEKEKQAEEDLKQLLLVLAAKEDRLQMDVDALQEALDSKDVENDRLMKEISRQQLALKERDEQMQASEQQVGTQKKVIDMLDEKNKLLLRELAEAKESASSSEGILKAYLDAAPAETTYTTFESISPHSKSSPRSTASSGISSPPGKSKNRQYSGFKGAKPGDLEL